MLKIIHNYYNHVYGKPYSLYFTLPFEPLFDVMGNGSFVYINHYSNAQMSNGESNSDVM